MAVAPPSTTKPRSGTPYTIIGLILAALGFGAVILFANLSGGKAAAASPSGQEVDVVVAAADISIRTPIVPGSLAIQKMSAADKPPGAFTKVDEVKNMVAAIDIKKGQPVTGNVLVKSGDAVSGPQSGYLPIPTGFVAITIPTGEQQGVAGYIQTGDYVSIIGVVTGSTGQNVRTLFTNVHVLRIGPAVLADPAAGSSAPSARTGGVSSSLTVIVTQCQAEYLNWFVSNATVKYSLESYKDYRPQDVQVDSTCPSVTAARGVTKSDIGQRWPGIFG